MASLPHTTPHPPNPPPNLPAQTQPPNPILHPPYYVDPSQVYLLPPSPPAPPPRPRKPYTSTKVREMWTSEEHERMLEALRLYKRNWTKVTKYVGTRSAAQVRSHAQKYFDRVARDKTDDYVPRARPKRKSATPYPRKARVDSPQLSHAPIPVPPPQSPVLSPSPVLSHPPLTVPYQHVYSPYVVDRSVSAPHPPSTLPAAPSPLSYVAGYPSPVPHVVSAHHMYGMFSPITPSYPPQAPPPAVSHAPVAVAKSTPPQPVHTHVPTHSHPGGFMDNCSKCVALRRYGNVFQEIGEFRHSTSAQPLPHTCVPRHSAPTHLQVPPRVVHQLPMPSPQQSGDNGTRVVGHDKEAKVEVVEEKLNKGPAEYRAHRAKVMKARKAKSRNRLPKAVQSSASERSSSESFSAARNKDLSSDEAGMKCVRGEKDILSVDRIKKRKSRGVQDRPAKRTRTLVADAGKGGKVRSEAAVGNKTGANESSRRASSDSSPMTQIAEDKSEESTGKGRSSPVVDNYSQKEQKEIYDAVKSLQILAKTSSLSSQESKAKRVDGCKAQVSNE